MPLTKSSIFSKSKKTNDNTFSSIGQSYIELQRSNLDKPYTVIIRKNKNNYTYEITYNNETLVKEIMLPEIMYRNEESTFNIDLIVSAHNEVLKSCHNEKEYKEVEQTLTKLFIEEGSNYYKYGVFDEMSLYHFIVINIGTASFKEVMEDTEFLKFLLPNKPKTIKEIEIHYLANMFSLHN